MFYKLPLGALGTTEEPLAKWDVFHWVHTKCQLPPRKVGQGDEVNDSSWESLCCSRSGSEDQHSHPLSILWDEDRENIFLPGWCKPGTGLAVAWEALSIFRSQEFTHAQGCLFRSGWAETPKMPFFCVGLHRLPFYLYDGKCDFQLLNTRSMDSPHQDTGCLWPTMREGHCFQPQSFSSGYPSKACHN